MIYLLHYDISTQYGQGKYAIVALVMIQPNAPLPREDRLKVAHQMALYANESEVHLIEARRLATVACAQFFQYAEHVRAMESGDPRYFTDDGTPIISANGLESVGKTDIRARLNREFVFAWGEEAWANMLEINAHYRALHGRYDYARGIDNSDYYGPFDWCVSQWKTQILSGKRSDFIQPPDFRAISDLIEAGGRDVAAEAYGSISVQYSCDALHILRLEGIAPPELPLTSF